LCLLFLLLLLQRLHILPLSVQLLFQLVDHLPRSSSGVSVCAFVLVKQVVLYQ
jgi:hypothetical protein